MARDFRHWRNVEQTLTDAANEAQEGEDKIAITLTSNDIWNLINAVDERVDEAAEEGYSDGRSEGYDDGYTDGEGFAEERVAEARQDGYDNGYADGLNAPRS